VAATTANRSCLVVVAAFVIVYFLCSQRLVVAASLWFPSVIWMSRDCGVLDAFRFLMFHDRGCSFAFCCSYLRESGMFVSFSFRGFLRDLVLCFVVSVTQRR
jgi:hypothetical protein